MAKHFVSVLKLVDSGSTEDSSNPPLSLNANEEESRLTLPPAPPPTTALQQQGQPLPLPPSSKQVSLRFDKILPPTASSASLYKQSVKEVVENVLLGYHGTIITLSSSEASQEKHSSLWDPTNSLIQRAVKQMFRCLKKSRKSKSKASALKLVILCSYAVVIKEEVRDLLCGLKQVDTNVATSSGNPGVGNNPKLEVLPPKLEVVNGQAHGLSQHVITTSSEVKALLKYGKVMEQNLLRSLPPLPSSNPDHHSLFTLSVEFNQFGSMNAPVSGNLLFADVAALDPLASPQRFTRGDVVDKGKKSLFTFAKIVESLSSNIAAVEPADSALLSEEETHLLPNVPSPDTSNLYQQSVLTQLIEDSLGGNCKTLLITYAPVHVTPSLHRETMEALKLASRARILQNTPNKRDLAEKALMSAYLRGLEEVYGQGMREKEKEVQPEVFHSPVTSLEVGGGKGRKQQAKSSSRDSITSGDIEDAYEEMIVKTKGEERQKHMELAATALVAATLQDKEEEGSEGSGSEAENDNEEISYEEDGSNSTIGQGSSKNDKENLSKSDRKKHSNVLILLNEEQNVTLEALVSILQDPDTGVPRPSLSALDNVRVKKGAGALFSGAAIVKWLVSHISGVKSEGDAQMLGQMLLDSGHIFHSEGSSVFAGAETLFYHARYARTAKKSLALDEIQSLLNTAASQAAPPSNTGDASKPSKPHLPISTLGSDAGKSELEASMNKLPAAVEVELRQNDESQSFVNHTSLNAGTEGNEMEGLSTTHTAPQRRENDLVVKEVEGGNEGVAKEEWMEASNSSEEEEGESNADPNIENQRKIPTIQTLESTVNYPHPLHMAAAIGKRPGVIRELIMMFGVDKLDNSRRTPLMFAALGNNKSSSCGTLIKCSADVNAQDASGLTALHVACYHGNVSAAGILLSHEASVASRDNKDHTALHWSMIPDETGCLELLTRYSLHSDLLNYPDKSGLTAVHWGIFYDHPQHLNILLKKRSRSGLVDLTQLDSQGRTYAIYAIEKNSPRCLKVLLAAEPSLLNLPGHVPATFAPLDAEASLPCLPESVVSYPAHYAAIQEGREALDVLLGFTPRKSSPETLDIDMKDQVQWTSLHYAVAYNRLPTATALVTSGARVDVKDSEGRTVMDLVLELPIGKEEMLAVLKNEVTCQASTANKEGPKGISRRESRGPSEHKRSRICILL